MSAPKDVKIAMDVQQMAAYGYFKEEFLFYCYAYQHEGQITYKISEDPLSIYKAYFHCVFDDYYPTPIQFLLKDIMVPAGERPTYKLQCKMELIQKMRTIYGQAFFDAIQFFQMVQPLDTAASLLHTILHQLTAQAEAHQLFRGLCHQSLEAKLLTTKSYASLIDEANRIYGQLGPIIQPQLGQGKLLSGFAYWSVTNPVPTYYCSATLEESYHKYFQLKHTGFLCSPIIQKSYWYRSANDFKSIKATFRELLKTCITHNQTIEKINQLQALSPAINVLHYKMLYDDLKQHATEETCTAFRNYGYQFHIFS